MESRHAPTPTGGDPKAMIEQLSALAMELRECAHLELAPYTGVALPGIWDARTFVMRRAFNLSRLEGVDFGALFQSALGPCRFETDVTAAASAQWRAHPANPHRFVYLSIGTGVGGAVLINGQPIRHTMGGAGRLGHLIVDTAADAPAGKSGIQGCLEALLCDAGGGLVALERRASALAVGLLQLTHLFAPDVIAIAGGLIERAPELLHAAQTRFHGVGSHLKPESLRIEPAPLPGAAAGVIGAALLAHATAL